MKRHRRQKSPRRLKHKKITYKEYRQQCRFKFNLEDFPQEFDLNLIEEFGWYSEENQNGVSRDHMVSISFGWKRDIPPKIISHPANCNLLLYEDNKEKGWRSSFNYGELIKRISAWNKNYK